MINRRALFSFFAALPLLPFVGAAKARAGNLLTTTWPYALIKEDKVLTVPIEEFADCARIKNSNGIPWVWFKSPSRNCWCKAYNPNYQQKADQPLPTWREQIKFEAVPLSTITNK